MCHSPIHLSSALPAHRLIALLTLFFVLGVVYALATPLFENPDESSHLQVIRYFAAERRLYAPATVQPPLTGADMAAMLRPHTPPLYYTPPLYHALAAILVGGIDMADLDSRLIPNPAWDAGWAPQRNADPWNKNMFVHLPGENWAASATFRATLLLRLLSLSFSLVTIVCTYHIARLIDPARPAFALGAAACVALNPQFIALSAGVTNDPLLIAIVSLATLGMLRLMGTAARWPHWVTLGALVGLGLLTKQTALLLLPLGAWQSSGRYHARPGPGRKFSPTRSRLAGRRRSSAVDGTSTMPCATATSGEPERISRVKYPCAASVGSRSSPSSKPTGAVWAGRCCRCHAGPMS